MSQKEKNGLSLIVPLYKSELNLPSLFEALEELSGQISDFEVVFVVDGSPDECENILVSRKASLPYASKVIVHSRNFGPYAAVHTGLNHAREEICAIMAADLQEPPELILKFYNYLQNSDIDIAVGTRSSRNDGWFTDLTSELFWLLYSRLINRDIPVGGVDIFAVRSQAKAKLLELKEADSSMIAQLFWIGFNRIEIPYTRRKREIGKSASSFKKRFKYMSDSILSFSNFPIKTMSFLGAIFLFSSLLYGVYILFLALSGRISEPGFATLILVMVSGFSINIVCLSILGAYIWRTFRNTQNRPQSIVKKIL